MTVTGNQDNNNRWISAILAMVLLILLLMCFGCKTKTVVEEKQVFIKDSIMVTDTVYKKSIEVIYDTTYVRDNYTEKYYIGSIDTIYKIRVDTVKVFATQYIYRERSAEKTDTTKAVASTNQQQQATVQTTQVVSEKKSHADRWVCFILGMILVGAVWYAVWKFVR